MADGRKRLRVFFLEDNPDDVELELYELRHGGFDVTPEVARSKREFLERLPSLDVDIIIADYQLPDITGIEAIHLCQEGRIDAPVILITGVGNELVAVDSLREGAADYILKKNITGLAARVSRAIDIWKERKASKEAEEEKQRLQQQLSQAQKLESIGRLAGGVAHDFNNLLTGIMGAASLVLRELPEASPFTKNIRLILSISERASDLIRQLLLYSRQVPLEFTAVDPNDLVAETIAFMGRVVEETVEINAQLQEDIPHVRSDKGQLSQVLINLAVNARDAMQGRGELGFKTERCRLDPSVCRNDNPTVGEEYVCVSVSDTGCGIADDDIAKIFDPFFTTKEVGQGTGLGLATVHAIVSRHDGWIEVDSRKGEGSTFKVYLPVSPEEVQHPDRSERAVTCGELWGADKTILVAEDEEFLRSLLEEILGSLGYHVLMASDGEEALQIFKENAERIALVVSDRTMPKKTGTELLEEIKEINSSVKFVLMTGYRLDDIDAPIRKKMDGILNKPYTMDTIASTIVLGGAQSSSDGE
jgi:signal transduction histidine kinase